MYGTRKACAHCACIVSAGIVGAAIVSIPRLQLAERLQRVALDRAEEDGLRARLGQVAAHQRVRGAESVTEARLDSVERRVQRFGRRRRGGRRGGGGGCSGGGGGGGGGEVERGVLR